MLSKKTCYLRKHVEVNPKIQVRRAETMRKTKTAAAMVLLAGLILWGCGDSQSGDGDMEVEAAEDLSAQVEVRKDGSITRWL